MKKKIIILGSTGSIGSTTLNIIKNDKKNFKIELLSTNKNIKKVFNQAVQFNVKNIIVSDYQSYIKAKEKYSKYKIKFHKSFSVIDSLFKKNEIFYTMVSVVGIDGLDPTLRSIKYSKNIAIINKESLICGWNLISEKLKRYKTNFFPVDSEHFSIFSLIDKNQRDNIDTMYITASGGPFLNYSLARLSKAKLKDALNHPNWSMGKKISVDSSTMMNKVFEVIEAKKIFNFPYKKIEILIHPKSYIHALVKFKNGITKILLHDPDMKIPIHNTIYYLDNKTIKTKSLNYKILNNLNFQKVDTKKFPLIKILNILPKKNSLYETALISINDYFVSMFLKKKITYKELINSINSHAHNKFFLKLRKKTPKNIHDIQKIRNYVYSKLNNSGI
jgi:1-deoxy-D-xylulose-5-phosphate reductoisomerase